MAMEGDMRGYGDDSENRQHVLQYTQHALYLRHVPAFETRTYIQCTVQRHVMSDRPDQELSSYGKVIDKRSHSSPSLVGVRYSSSLVDGDSPPHLTGQARGSLG